MDSSTDSNSSVGEQPCGIQEDDPYRDAKLFDFSLSVFISLFGLISNSLVIAVKRQIKSPTSTDVYITFLAITDNMMVLSFNMYGYVYAYPILFAYVESFTKAGVVAMCAVFFMMLNTYTIVLVNVDRFMQVKYVAQAKTWCTRRRAILHLIFVGIGTIMFNLPRFWEYIPLLSNPDETVNKCFGYYTRPYGMGADSRYTFGYAFLTYLVVTYILPLIILTVTNFTVILAVIRRRKWLKQMRSEASAKADNIRMKKNEVSAIITLVSITTVFMILQIPGLAAEILWNYFPQHGPTADLFILPLRMINSSVNFIIYVVCSNVFRPRLAALFGCEKVNQPDTRYELKRASQNMPEERLSK